MVDVSEFDHGEPFKSVIPLALMMVFGAAAAITAWTRQHAGRTRSLKKDIKKGLEPVRFQKTIKLETIILLSFFWCLDSFKNGYSAASSKYL